MPGGNDPVSLGEASIVRETDRAVLAILDDSDGEEVWMPKSVIHDDSEAYSTKSSTGELIVMEWWARSNGYA